MIGAFVPYISRLKRSYQSNDIVDRMNYQYTSMIVMVCAITLAATQYVGKPIQCWVPAQFTGAWEKYTETYCFIKGSYFVPDDDFEMDESYVNREHAEIGYYQWVPLMLAFQAFCFFFPSLFWRSMNFNTGINVKAVLDSAAKIKKKVSANDRRNQVRAAAAHVEEALDMQREIKLKKREIQKKFRSSGRYLSVLYLFTKVLYVLNIFLQFIIFAVFLDIKGNQATWGWDILHNLLNGREWEETGHFPRVTMCDFNVRVLGNLHRWTVQCVLMINMFTEKIYVFLWFWVGFVGFLSILSLLYWTATLILPSSHRDFIAKYLRCTSTLDIDPREEEKKVDDFVKNYLTPDGVFLCRLVQTNGGDLLTGEIIAELYQQYEKLKNSDVPFDSPDSGATLPR